MPWGSTRWLAAGTLVLVATVASPQQLPPSGPGDPAISLRTTGLATTERRLQIADKKWTGDFDRMLERRTIRVDAPYSRSLYYNDKGRERGLAAELVRDFERWINQKYAKQLRNRPLTVYLRPATRDRLLADVAGGLADIAVGNLTVTDERLKSVAMVAPQDLPDVREIVLTGPTSARLSKADDLAGRIVHVRRSSSYFESLSALNQRFRKAGMAEMKLVFVPEALEDEDMMEMTNASLFEAIVVDEWKARIWAQVLPKLTLNDSVALREGGRTGWAIRKASPKLAAEITDFHVNWAKKQGVIAYRLERSMKRVKELNDPSGTAEWKRFRETLALFDRYGAKYGFDPLMLAAQGYQESQLDQSKRSRAGAIGVMQVMPRTGAQMKVGNIQVIEPNIHAGAKYMDELMTKHFRNAKFVDDNRALFAFASYNAGPGNIAKARKEAARRGFDPNKWFNNVEVVVSERIGSETTTYVRNIYKYYVGYKLLVEAQDARDRARQRVAAQKG